MCLDLAVAGRDLVGVLEVPVHQVADDRDGATLLAALLDRLVDVLEHEVAQLVHHAQRRVVHADGTGTQRLVDDGVDHRADPLPARLTESLEHGRRKGIGTQGARAQGVEGIVREVGDPIGEPDAEGLRRGRWRVDLPGVGSDPVAHLPGQVGVLQHLEDANALRGVVPGIGREVRREGVLAGVAEG